MDCQKKVVILDPSEIFRPLSEEFQSNKKKGLFRNFISDKDDVIQQRVRQTYLQMHKNQTVDFVRNKINYWTKFDKAEMTIMEALDKMDDLIDESDPDVDVPNSVHAFQTAERIRQMHPQHDWFHLTGLVHDLGKVMALIGQEEQWAVVGDTFPVGCAFDESIVYSKDTFQDNPDLKNTLYNTKLGIYKENCGLDNVIMSWGHDEYLYRVLRNHSDCRLPLEALYMIRYHSFYPWHSCQAYGNLMNDQDQRMLPWIKEFNKFDLYTKSDDLPEVEKVRDYYRGLIEKYIPGLLNW